MVRKQMPVAKETNVRGNDFMPNVELAFRDRFADLGSRIKDLNYMMYVVVFVLLIGFLTCLIGVAAIFVQFWGLNANMQSELTKSVKENVQMQNSLNNSVNRLNGILENKATQSGQ